MLFRENGTPIFKDSVNLGTYTPNNKNIGKKYEQSANALFNFMAKAEYLKNILRDKKLIPRYYEENIKYLKIKEFDRIAFPMKCFCDIYLNRLESHVKIYGKYGIALSKTWGLKNKIQPIHYVAPKSSIVLCLKKMTTKWLNKGMDKASEEFLFRTLKLTKPLYGKMPRDGKEISKNFHDEKEWRFVPRILNDLNDMPDIIYEQARLNDTIYSRYSEGLEREIKWSIPVSFSDIKYLIVPNNIERNNFIEYIINDCKGLKEEKYILLSKLLVLDELKEDW